MTPQALRDVRTGPRRWDSGG